MKPKQEAVVIANKKVGETPLECLERVRREKGIPVATPMTYAGRLDPMADGVLLLLVGEECKNKAAYTGLDKVYEVEILFGVETDTYDVLGLLVEKDSESRASGVGLEALSKVLRSTLQEILKKYVGKFEQKYPPYSSKTVDGKALHSYAREGALPSFEDMPTKDVEIYSIDVSNDGESFQQISGKEIAHRAIEKINMLSACADFRQEEIIQRWTDFAKKYADVFCHLIRIRVACSSGTYMRSLAHEMGKDLAVAGCSAIAFSIKRISVGDYRAGN